MDHTSLSDQMDPERRSHGARVAWVAYAAVVNGVIMILLGIGVSFLGQTLELQKDQAKAQQAEEVRYATDHQTLVDQKSLNERQNAALQTLVQSVQANTDTLKWTVTQLKQDEADWRLKANGHQ